ncbi:ABC transporter transmembrane region 2-domain-containing protein [Pisolithus croceorrhizus]|nr:ABC transporter transmembrane region 2-domain-containing protein [Pisolithus croceorrhizus]KAI6132552.1 ABC transporter transmembrane region 2-domain-containing protein [Pisolithus croceorrhizus]KAI6139883.1 ABC transporter transmembrane region 2-domain-containing protein [Pisolithus thermaeus]
MAAFSKPARGNVHVAVKVANRVNRLLQHPPTRRSLLLLLASALIVRSAVFRPCCHARPAYSDEKSPRIVRERESHSSDAEYFPVDSRARTSNGHLTPRSVTSTFLHRLRALLRIIIPSLFTKEAFLLIAHSCFLVLRTVLSVAVARLDGKIVRHLVSANGRGFLRGLGLWFALAVPSVYTNSMIRHLQSKLALKFRTRMTEYIQDLYLSPYPDLRYYRVPLQGVDQYITADVEAWSESIAGIYGNLMKPSLDLLLFTSQLARELGFRGTVLLFVNYYITVKILRAVTPAFGQLAAVEARLEGEYRAGVNRVARESEEIAFYDGGAREREILTRVYLRLIRHINSIYKIRIAYEWTEDFVIKYLWSAAGYGLIAVPLLITRKHRGGGTRSEMDGVFADRTETYISNRRLLLSLADAGGRLMYAYKDLVEVAGLTGRLYSLLSTLHHLPKLPPALPGDGNTFELKNVDVCIPSAALPSSESCNGVNGEIDQKRGMVIQGDSSTLVRALSMRLHRGMHLMITGSNGVGKTAVARVLAGLWAPCGPLASVTRPSAEPADDDDRRRPRPGLFVVPQRAYMVTGSLLEQVIYPQSLGIFYAEGGYIQELEEILEAAHLGYLVEREGGWGAVKEWRDVLSGGEKQRMSLARVFYHRPKFAILDECTSAVSSDVEGQMYEHAKSLGISLITISLRPSLAKYHTHLLTLMGGGTGNWTLTPITSSSSSLDTAVVQSEESVHSSGGWMELEEALAEIQVLEGKLEEAGKWESRLAELKRR